MQETKPISETIKNGYISLKTGIFFRRRWQSYAYLDRRDDYAGDHIFAKHHIYVAFYKRTYVSPNGKYQFVFCRVRKQDAKMFEACLAQLHTILSKEDGYDETLAILMSLAEES